LPDACSEPVRLYSLCLNAFFVLWGTLIVLMVCTPSSLTQAWSLSILGSYASLALIIRSNRIEIEPIFTEYEQECEASTSA